MRFDFVPVDLFASESAGILLMYCYDSGIPYSLLFVAISRSDIPPLLRGRPSESEPLLVGVPAWADKNRPIASIDV